MLNKIIIDNDKALIRDINYILKLDSRLIDDYEKNILAKYLFKTLIKDNKIKILGITLDLRSIANYLAETSQLVSLENKTAIVTIHAELSEKYFLLSLTDNDELIKNDLNPFKIKITVNKRNRYIFHMPKFNDFAIISKIMAKPYSAITGREKQYAKNNYFIKDNVENFDLLPILSGHRISILGTVQALRKKQLLAEQENPILKIFPILDEENKKKFLEIHILNRKHEEIFDASCPLLIEIQNSKGKVILINTNKFSHDPRRQLLELFKKEFSELTKQECDFINNYKQEITFSLKNYRYNFGESFLSFGTLINKLQSQGFLPAEINDLKLSLSAEVNIYQEKIYFYLGVLDDFNNLINVYYNPVKYEVINDPIEGLSLPLADDFAYDERGHLKILITKPRRLLTIKDRDFLLNLNISQKITNNAIAFTPVQGRVISCFKNVFKQFIEDRKITVPTDASYTMTIARDNYRILEFMFFNEFKEKLHEEPWRIKIVMKPNGYQDIPVGYKLLNTPSISNRDQTEDNEAEIYFDHEDEFANLEKTDNRAELLSIRKEIIQKNMSVYYISEKSNNFYQIKKGLVKEFDGNFAIIEDNPQSIAYGLITFDYASAYQLLIKLGYFPEKAFYYKNRSAEKKLSLQ